MNKEQLMEVAREAKVHAYKPYSNFAVGAALLLNDGTVFKGVNVENVSFGATNCTERTAMFTAIAEGYKKGDFQAIAVAGDTDDFLSPCSVCRQVLVEFCAPHMPVYLTNGKNGILSLIKLEM